MSSQRVADRCSEESVGTLSSSYRLSKDVIWEIDRFLDLRGDERHVLTTPVFQFQSQEWKVWLWPNYRPDYILLYLMRRGQSTMGPNRTAQFRLSLKRRDGTEQTIETKVFSLDGECSKFRCALISFQLTRSLLDKERETFLPGGRLTLFFRLSVEGTAIANEVSTQTEAVLQGGEIINKPLDEGNAASGSSVDDETEQNPNTEVLYTLIQNLKDLYVSKNNSDVTIKVKTETFKAHRAILGARSPVMAAMFSHDMAEAETGEISMEDCDPKAFEIFLQFVYSGTVKNMSNDNAFSVYYVADKYDLPELKEDCIRCMITNLSIDSVCNVIKTAVKHDESELLERATEFFQENAPKIFPTNLWERFMVQNPALAQDLIVGSLKYANAK